METYSRVQEEILPKFQKENDIFTAKQKLNVSYIL